MGWSHLSVFTQLSVFVTKFGTLKYRLQKYSSWNICRNLKSLKRDFLLVTQFSLKFSFDIAKRVSCAMNDIFFIACISVLIPQIDELKNSVTKKALFEIVTISRLNFCSLNIKIRLHNLPISFVSSPVYFLTKIALVKKAKNIIFN